MDNEFYDNFLDVSSNVIDNGSLQGSFVNREGDDSIAAADQALLSLFSSSLRKSIENLDEELARFEKNFASGNNSIFWALDYNDVFVYIKKIIKLHKVRTVRLPNVNSSTIFRELGIKYFLQEENIALSDNADLQFFAVDMIFSDTGSLLLLNQSNNSLAKLSNTSTNIFFATIDSICNNSNWVETIQQLLSYNSSSSRQDMILFKSSANCSNYLFIIDNQRLELLKDPRLRQSLTCIGCGRCNDACPVFRTIGSEPYNNVFAGPVANITLPFLETFESYRHVPYVCTLCGRCEKVCPLKLPLREMNIHVRSLFFGDGVLDKEERRLMAAMRKMAFSRKKLNGSRFKKKHLLVKYLSSLRKSRSLPLPANECFNKSFRKAYDQQH